MVNLSKKEKGKLPWVGFEIYFFTGLLVTLLMFIAGAVGALIVLGFIHEPVITGSIFGIIIFVFVVGYVTVHVFERRADDL